MYYLPVVITAVLLIIIGLFALWVLSIAYWAICGDTVIRAEKIKEARKAWKDE